MCQTMFKYFNDVPFNVPFNVGFWCTSTKLFNLSIWSRFTLSIDRDGVPHGMHIAVGSGGHECLHRNAVAEEAKKPVSNDGVGEPEWGGRS